MASQVLYLKWRPQRFQDMVGQEHITTTLQNALRSGRIAHAYLFAGPRGTGKTTAARLLAKAVNCLDKDINNRPCNQCHICRAVNEGRLMDLIEMDAASNTGVDNVREAIRQKVGFRPNEARYKVYVIDEVHMLSTSAFNALLKTLEEPPEHVIFVLATTEPHKILPTIISRCQRFDFRRIPLAALVGRLQKIADQEGLNVDQDALRFIARISTGCARDAIGLLDQLTAYGDDVITLQRVHDVLGLGSAQTVHQLVAHLATHDVGAGLGIINQAVEQGVDIRQFTQQVIEYLRALLLLVVGDNSQAQELAPSTREGMQVLAGQFSLHHLVQAIKLLNQAQLDMRGSDQNQIALELAVVQAVLPQETAASPETTAAAPVATIAPSQAAPGTTPPGTTPPAAQTPPTARQAPSPATNRPTPPAAAPVQPAPEAPVQETGPAQPAEPPVELAMTEINLHWSKIRQAIRTENRQAEALVNSGTIRGVEDRNCVVFELPSKLLCEKLEKTDTRQIVEQALNSVLGKRCRVRAAVAGSLPPPTFAPAASSPPDMPSSSDMLPSTDTPPSTDMPPSTDAPPSTDTSPSADTPPSAAAPTESSPPAPETRSRTNLYQEAVSDPVVQELVKRGGQVTKVEEITEE